MWGQYQQKLQPLTQQSERLLQDYYALQSQLPTFQSRLLESIKKAEMYPSHAELRAEYMKNPDLTPQAIEALVSKRGMATRGSIADIIGRATGGLESEIAGRQAAAQQAQQQRAGLLEEYGLAFQAQQAALDRLRQAEQDRFAREKWEATRATAGTARAEKAAKKARLADITEYLVSPEVGTRGEAQESIRAIIQRNPDLLVEILATGEALYPEAEGLDQEAINAYVSMINSGEIKLANVPKEYKAEVSKRVAQPTVETEGEGSNWIDRILEIVRR